METSKAVAIAIVSFLLTAGVTAQWHDPNRGKDVTAPRGPRLSIGWSQTAHAYAPVCFSRCRETEASCQTGCWDNFNDCTRSSAAPDQCRQTRDGCVRRCVSYQTTCMQRCL